MLILLIFLKFQQKSMKIVWVLFFTCADSLFSSIIIIYSPSTAYLIHYSDLFILIECKWTKMLWSWLPYNEIVKLSQALFGNWYEIQSIEFEKCKERRKRQRTIGSKHMYLYVFRLRIDVNALKIQKKHLNHTNQPICSTDSIEKREKKISWYFQTRASQSGFINKAQHYKYYVFTQFERQTSNGQVKKINHDSMTRHLKNPTAQRTNMLGSEFSHSKIIGTISIGSMNGFFFSSLYILHILIVWCSVARCGEWRRWDRGRTVWNRHRGNRSTKINIERCTCEYIHNPYSLNAKSNSNKSK